MEKNPDTLQRYSDFLQEYDELGHMVRVPVSTIGNTGDLRRDGRLDEMALGPGASATKSKQSLFLVGWESRKIISWKHGVSDASQSAMAEVVYLKVTGSDGVRISLAADKTKVAPIQHLTIPRLEHNAAVILGKLTRDVRKEINLVDTSVILWTD